MNDKEYLDLITTWRRAETMEELMDLTKELGFELTDEIASAYFNVLHPAGSGELSEDELENVSGGGCQTSTGSGKHTVVTSMTTCFTRRYESNWPRGYIEEQGTEFSAMRTPINNGIWVNTYDPVYAKDNLSLRKMWSEYSFGNNSCGMCRHLCFKGGLGYCGLA